MKKLLLILLLFSLFLSCSIQNVSDIHTRALVIDTHTDTPMQLINRGLDLSIKHKAPDSRVDFPRLREGEVDAIFFALFTSQQERIQENYDKAYALANQMIDSTLFSLQENSTMAELAINSEDVADFPKITSELVNRGYSQEEINKIWGDNFLRVFKAVELLAN